MSFPSASTFGTSGRQDLPGTRLGGWFVMIPFVRNSGP